MAFCRYGWLCLLLFKRCYIILLFLWSLSGINGGLYYLQIFQMFFFDLQLYLEICTRVFSLLFFEKLS